MINVEKCNIEMRLQLTVAGRVRPIMRGAACFWVACRGHVYELTPSAAVCGYRQRNASPWHAFATGPTRASTKKLKKIANVTFEMNFRRRSRVVRTENWTTRSASGTPAEGLCMAIRQWPQFVVNVGLRPLSGVLF